MSTHELPPTLVLFRMITGYYLSQAIHVAARLGIADFLGDRSVGIEDIAARTRTHAPSLRRILRLLASAGLFAEDEEGRFSLTSMGTSLRSSATPSMHAAALLFGGITQKAWGDLLHSVETGEPAFSRVFGMDAFTYFSEHPEEGANFDAAMAGFTAQIASAVASTYNLTGCRRVVDVGGGNGALLAGVLRVHPHLEGVLFDLPQVVERVGDGVRTLGLAERFRVVGGDFFEGVPEGADVYLLKHVIHDWNDERAAEILKNCRRAMTADARVVIVEGVYPGRIDGSEQSRSAASNDVNMLVCTGGRQRSEEEFRTLYHDAGLRLTQILPTPMSVHLIEGARV